MQITKLESGGLIKAWVDGVQFEDQARQQVENVASLPFIHHHVAVMADVHYGKGATIGSVIPTIGAIVPAAVGVDLGCGLFAARTTMLASQMPDNLHTVRTTIEAAVPHGRTNNGGNGDKGAWSGNVPDTVAEEWLNLYVRYDDIVRKYPEIQHHKTSEHLGTLGTGNHFIECCIDEMQSVWLMLHSGSRGPGNKIGSFFIEKAKREMEKWFIHLPDKDLAYLPEGSELFDDYIEAVGWAQDYALANRRAMMQNAIKALQGSGQLPAFQISDEVVDCHHNYVARENHFGKNVYVTRKGACRARLGDLSIIPGSMGAKSFIVRGKGNPDSFNSCSHGAGRSMSRGDARRKFTLQDHAAATVGVECRKDEEVIDETPAAYKSIDAVMAAQADLVEIVHTLKQVLCVKG